jgi:hypothetical protein
VRCVLRVLNAPAAAGNPQGSRAVDLKRGIVAVSADERAAGIVTHHQDHLAQVAGSVGRILCVFGSTAATTAVHQVNAQRVRGRFDVRVLPVRTADDLC